MIRVRIGKERVTVRGHAGSAPKGSDLVCAAVSALVYALAFRLYELESAGRIANAQPRMDAGDAEIVWQGEAEEAVAVFRAGIRLLEKNEPNYIKLEEDAYG